jgi:hypothetical protein
LYPEGAAETPDAGAEVTARFDVIWLAGWAPGPDQPKPLSPGSATGRLADALKTEEHPAGEKPRGGMR